MSSGPTTVARICILLFVAASCVSGPQPVPPTGAPRPDPPTDGWSGMDAMATSGCSAGSPDPDDGWRPVLLNDVVLGRSAEDRVTIVGPSEIVQPGGIYVTATSLDSIEPSTTVEVSDEGAFEMTLEGDVTEELRLVAEYEGSHSAPLDITWDEESEPSCEAHGDAVCWRYLDERGCITDPLCLWSEAGCERGLVELEGSCDELAVEARCIEAPGCFWAVSRARVLTRPVPACLRVQPRRWMSFGRRAIGESRHYDLYLENNCGERRSFDIATREGDPSFSVDDLVGEALIVDGGADVFVPVTFAPVSEGYHDDVVFISLESGERWAISLWGEGAD